MKLPRFRVRTLLNLVALAGVGVWGYAMRRRSEKYYTKARLHEGYEQHSRRDAESGRWFAGHVRDGINFLKIRRDHIASSDLDAKEKVWQLRTVKSEEDDKLALEETSLAKASRYSAKAEY